MIICSHCKKTFYDICNFLCNKCKLPICGFCSKHPQCDK